MHSIFLRFVTRGAPCLTQKLAVKKKQTVRFLTLITTAKKSTYTLIQSSLSPQTGVHQQHHGGLRVHRRLLHTASNIMEHFNDIDIGCWFLN